MNFIAIEISVVVYQRGRMSKNSSFASSVESFFFETQNGSIGKYHLRVGTKESIMFSNNKRLRRSASFPAIIHFACIAQMRFIAVLKEYRSKARPERLFEKSSQHGHTYLLKDVRAAANLSTATVTLLVFRP